jgi:hypothetical protein
VELTKRKPREENKMIPLPWHTNIGVYTNRRTFESNNDRHRFLRDGEFQELREGLAEILKERSFELEESCTSAEMPEKTDLYKSPDVRLVHTHYVYDATNRNHFFATGNNPEKTKDVIEALVDFYGQNGYEPGICIKEVLK